MAAPSGDCTRGARLRQGPSGPETIDDLATPRPRIFGYNLGAASQFDRVGEPAMHGRKFGWSVFVLLALAIKPACSPAEESWEALKEARLTATGRVILPDGSPATNVIVSAMDHVQFNDAARTDAQGQFQLPHLFGNYVGLHAHTPDWRLQVCHWISAGHARIALRQPVELKLAPANEQRVLVKSQGRPVGGIRLVAIGNSFRASGITGIDGRASLWIPHGGDWHVIAAWDARLGGAVLQCYSPSRPSGVVELALASPRPHTIRLVDQGDNRMRNLRFSLACAGADEFDDSSLRTNANGEVTVPWVPAGISFVEPIPRDFDWKVDDLDAPSGELRNATTIHVRRRRLVRGRLLMPPDVSAAGILVMGEGSGTGSTGDAFFTRARRDGTFVFPAASNHAYSIGIFDDEWACDVWTGVVLVSDEADPAAVSLKVDRASPLTIQVTWGPKAEPWNGPFVQVEQSKDFEWTDARGEHHDCGGGLRKYCPLDADGTARIGVARGECKLRVHLGPWEENRTLNIESSEPVFVAVHRPFKEHRELSGRLTHKGHPCRPTPSTVLRAWSIERSTFASPATVTAAADGQFHITADTERVGVYASDQTNGLCAFRWLDKKTPDAGNELELQPTGVYSGQIIDQDGKPVPRVRVKLFPKADVATLVNDALLQEAVSDDRGRFAFQQAPTGVILWPSIVLSRDREFRTTTESFLLKPEERRVGERNQVVTKDDPPPENPVIKSDQPAVNRLTELIRDARVLNLKVLVGAVGDMSEPVEETRRHLTDVEEVTVSRRYLSLWVSASESRARTELFSRLKLRPPKAGEMLLVVLDGDGRLVDFLYIAVGGSLSAFRLGDSFLRKHAPPLRDAKRLLTAARSQARATGRRVWVLNVNPLRPASLRLARWWEDHRTLLERDYVFVKLVQGCDAKIAAAMGREEANGSTESWFTITDADAEILADESGDFPRSADEKRRFRGLLTKTVRKLTAADVEHLMRSLN